jgi:hypothetical protein
VARTPWLDIPCWLLDTPLGWSPWAFPLATGRSRHARDGNTVAIGDCRPATCPESPASQIPHFANGNVPPTVSPSHKALSFGAEKVYSQLVATSRQAETRCKLKRSRAPLHFPPHSVRLCMLARDRLGFVARSALF